VARFSNPRTETFRSVPPRIIPDFSDPEDAIPEERRARVAGASGGRERE
jgi:hypothetical protein